MTGGDNARRPGAQGLGLKPFGLAVFGARFHQPVEAALGLIEQVFVPPRQTIRTPAAAVDVFGIPRYRQRRVFLMTDDADDRPVCAAHRAAVAHAQGGTSHKRLLAVFDLNQPQPLTGDGNAAVAVLAVNLDGQPRWPGQRAAAVRAAVVLPVAFEAACAFAHFFGRAQVAQTQFVQRDDAAVKDFGRLAAVAIVGGQKAVLMTPVDDARARRNLRGRVGQFAFHAGLRAENFALVGGDILRVAKGACGERRRDRVKLGHARRARIVCAQRQGENELVARFG